jgi:hypothetical protein
MLEPILVIARKEVLDSTGDVRSLVSSALYCLMGPSIVFMVSLTLNTKPAGRSVMIGMMSVFTLVSAFTGGMNGWRNYRMGRAIVRVGRDGACRGDLALFGDCVGVWNVEPQRLLGSCSPERLGLSRYFHSPLQP